MKRGFVLRDRILSSTLAKVFVISSLTFTCLWSWALSSPAGSDPDAGFHMSSIWCGDGYAVGQCEPPPDSLANESPPIVVIPFAVAAVGSCFSRNSVQSAACEIDISERKDLVPNQVNNQGGLYPKLYYFVSNHLVSDSVTQTAMRGRLLNILVAVFLMAVLFVIAVKAIFLSVALSQIFFALPLGMFLISSNNPSSWTITALTFHWAFLLTFLKSRTVLVGMSALAAVLTCTLLGTGSRLDGSLYIILSCLAIFVLLFFDETVSKNRKVAAFGVLLITIIFSYFFYSSTSQSGVVTGGLVNVPYGRTMGESLFYNIQNIPGLFVGVFGFGNHGAGLGHLDTPIPPLGSYAALIGAVAIMVLTRSRKTMSEWLCFGGLLVALIVVPMWVLNLDRALVGEGVQSRYMLPLIIMAAGIYFYIGQKRPTVIITFAGKIQLVGILGLAFFVALHTNLRRYVTGLDVVNFNLNSNKEWWPHGYFSPMSVFFAGGISFMFLSWMVLTQLEHHVTPKNNYLQAGLAAKSPD